MDELLRYIARYDPHFRGSVRGVQEEDLVALERLLGTGLPPSHRAFLSCMGQDLGTFRIADAVDFSVAGVRALLSDPAGLPLPQFFIPLGDAKGAMDDYYLDVRIPGAEPVVVQLASHAPPQGVRVSLAYSSLPNMLYGMAFLKKVIPLMPFEIHLRASGERSTSYLSDYMRIADRLGFCLLPGTGSFWPCHERDGTAMMMYEAPGYAPDVRVASRDRRQLLHLAELLIDNLGLYRLKGRLSPPPGP